MTTYTFTLKRRALRLKLETWGTLIRANPSVDTYLRAMLVGHFECDDSRQQTEDAAVASVMRERFADFVSVTESPFADECPF